MPKQNTATMQLPVFLPGNNREWEEISGMAIIHEDGKIEITLAHKEHGMELVKMQQAGKIIACSFDYIRDPEKMNNE